jgi:hypothetical protein
LFFYVCNLAVELAAAYSIHRGLELCLRPLEICLTHP